MVCPNCHQLIPNPNAKFCPHCGAPRAAAGHGAPKTQAMSPPQNAQLTIQLPGQAPYRVALTKSPVTIGRAQTNDIPISDPYVSNFHARLEQVGDTYRIIRIEAKNGTTVNGQIIQDQLLTSGDVIRIGHIRGNSVGLTYHAARAVAMRAPVTLDLRQPRITIGRSNTATLPLNDPLVSWDHAAIVFDGQHHILTDLGSLNGTRVNGTPLSPRQPYILHVNDLVQIGLAQFRYDRAGLTSFAGTRMRLDGENLNVWRGGKQTLQNVTVRVEPGKFICLVGASGAGKSTLMDALSGYRRAQQGRVMINGTDYFAEFDAFRSHVGYVPQQDILHLNLPLRRALRYAAELRLPRHPDLDACVARVLQTLELTEHQNKAIKDLSGGQRKRASIAVELLAEPSLFFLDEPTSGLDPGLEKELMGAMQQLAASGQTIILVTHATANINFCDYVAFMARGRLVYFGPPHEALTFFNQNDFADIYSELAEPTDPKFLNNPEGAAKDWETRFQQRQNQKSPLLAPPPSPPPPPRPKPSLFKQWWILTRRQFDMILRDPLTLSILILVLPLIGFFVLQIVKPEVLVGLNENQIQEKFLKLDETYSPVWNAQTLVFIMALAAVLLGIFAAAYEVVREQAIFKRERMVNLDIAPYILSKLFVLFLFGLAQTMLFLLILDIGGIEIPQDGIFLPAFVEIYLTLVLATLSSIALGLFISSAARSETMVVYIILLVLFLQIMFAGVIFDLRESAPGLASITTTHWTVDALGSSAKFRKLHFEKRTLPNTPLPNCQIGEPAGKPPKCAKLEKLYIEYGEEKDVWHLLVRWFILLGFTGLFLGLTVLAQKLKDEPSPFARMRQQLQPVLQPVQQLWREIRTALHIRAP